MRWWLLFPVYAGVVIVGTLAVRGRSMLEWVYLLIPPGKIQEFFVYLLQHHHPVVFARLLECADAFINLLLFLPLGMVLFFLLHRFFPESVRVLLLLAVCIGFTLSLGVETAQASVPDRVSSLSDMIANTGGTVLGCYLPYFWKRYKELRLSCNA
jgi:VanZ family protein